MIDIKTNNVFTGYSNFQDITNMPRTKLAAGSLNTIIPDGEKVMPRAGMAYFGIAGTPGVQSAAYWTLAHRIHSKYDDFVNKQGIKIPIRVYYSGISAQADVIEAWLPIYNTLGAATNQSKWYQITATTPTYPIFSTHRYFFAEWFDSSPTVLQPELIFTYGGTNIGNWSGGFAPITAFTGTTLTTDDVWDVKGFIWSPEGINYIIINGIEHIVTGGYGTNTITVASTAGVALGDVAFQDVYFNDTLGSGLTRYDVCSAINNQVYYIDWNQRNVYISWNRNQVASTTIVGSATLDDLNYTGTYNGPLQQIIKVRIDSIIDPPVTTFSAAVAGDQDNIQFSGTHTGSTRDTYRVVQNGAGPSFFYDIYFNGVFQANVPLGTPYTAPNGIVIQAIYGIFPTPNTDGDTWTFTIGGADTYAWYVNGTLQATGVSTVTPIVNSGVTYTFANPNGHSLGDSWEIINDPTIIRGWSQFSYNNPNRLPGQGFTLLLDSNGWTMVPQENTMYINAQAGHYYTVDIKLSANLLTESITIQRLKSEPQNKVLFPYLIRYIKNQMATISQDKTFDILGRQKFLELPQTKSISDEVRIDFETSDWEDGDILYFKRKIYFCVPRMGLIFVYDDYKKYWHSPQQFGKRISLLSIIDNKLIGHSYEENESYELYTGINDLGIFPIHTRMVFPYESFGNRMGEKQMSYIGFEGYVSGNPQITYTVNADLGGCGGQVTGLIQPQVTEKGLCLPTDTVSLGKSGLGYHGLGNDPVTAPPHFFYIRPFDNQLFYQRNIELSCDSLDQRWSIISLGTDVQMSNINNVSITDPGANPV